MATISGALLFDNARTGVSSPSMPGISGVPVVLQNTATNAMLAVTTDANGRYTFLNVPNGTYRIVEAYGTTAGSSPGDFSRAQIGSPAVAATPPISFAPSASPAANQLDAVTPNPLNTTVSGSDITGQDILNGPENLVVALMVEMTGDLTGFILLVQELKDARDLSVSITRAMGLPDEESDELLTEMQSSALLEISNILSGSYLSAISSLTSLFINSSPPKLVIDMAGAVMNLPAATYGEYGDTVLLMETEFEDAGKTINGHFFLIPDIKSFYVLMKTMGIE